MEMQLEGALPFFSRQETKSSIEFLASQDQLVLYAGAGVTIDRSSLGWRDLISGLMESYVPDSETRAQIFDLATNLQAASTAVGLYMNDHGDNYRDRLTDRLRVTLYNSEDWRVGTLASNLVNLLYAMNERRLEVAGGQALGSCLVTPNYDDYLWGQVEVLAEARYAGKPRGKRGSTPRLRFPTSKEPLALPGTPSGKSDAWINDPKFPQASEAPCIHLHGFVSRSHAHTTKARNSYRHPVVSEQDYFDTEQNSYRALVKLFSQSSVLIVGASMTDPPLLRALADTRDQSEGNGFVRYALVVMRPSRDIAERTSLQRLLSERYKRFGVTPVFADHYSQVSQFVQEIAVAVALEDPWEYGLSERRFGRRLVAWWRNWIKSASDSDTDSEFLFHEILHAASLLLEDILGVAADEHIKIEFWVRWKPKSSREMRLWATSIGTLADEALMRRAPLGADSPFSSIAALLEGRPVFRELLDSESPEKRWRTHLSVPVRIMEEGAELPVACITLASMAPRRHSALDPSKNKDVLVEAISMLADLGVVLSTPSLPGWIKYYEEIVEAAYME